jgi:hypothetical protein
MRSLALLAVAACHPSVPQPPPDLVTTAEKSAFARTGRYDEAIALCRDFARASREVSCIELGRSVEDRPIVALRISRHRGLPTILIEAGIHAGEIEGKDAGYMIVRDLIAGKVAPGALDAVDVVFVPCINPDGHERFGPNNRPNQRGPEQMGFRTNAARLNLNRDWMKADSPEIRAMLGAYRTYEPLVFVDIHTTDGAKFEHDISLAVGPRAPRPDQLDAAAVALGDSLAARLTELGHLPVTFYPAFVRDDDPASGFAIAEAPPRFSQAYAGQRGRIGILVENHSWKTYAQRVRSTYDMLRALLERAARDAPVWTAAVERARRADLQLAGSDVPLVFDNGPHAREIEFRGYAFERQLSELSGRTWIAYDETKPQIWRVPLQDELVPKIAARAPRAGYIIDGGFAPVVERVLDAHGIAHEPIAGEPCLAVESFRATKVTVQPLFEGRPRMQLDGAWADETRALDRGAIFVPIRQPHARLIVHLLDPAGPDSLAQWGELANAFERKEYMEPYVAEQVARDMVAKDPSVRARLDAETAPENRLDWVYRHHPAWDERLNLLPIYRVDTEPGRRSAACSK